MTAPSVHVDDGGTLVVGGALTFATVELVLGDGAQAVTARGASVVDLGGVDRADSAGLALLVEWLRAARREGRSLRFANVPEQLRAIAGTTGLDRLIFDD